MTQKPQQAEFQIVLKNRSFDYFRNDTIEIYLTGYIFIGQDCFFCAEELSNHIINKPTPEKEFRSLIKELLKEANGLFSLIIVYNDKCFACTDIVRSIPLFYLNYRGKNIITDDINPFKDDLTICEENIVILTQIIFTIGNDNLFNEIYTIQAAEILLIKKNGQPESERYFSFYPAKHTESITVQSFVSLFNLKLAKTLTRIQKSKPEINNWIVPLSGGHDSRIIVNALYNSGIRNVICYTYGTLGNWQSKVSKEVADTLGYNWVFIEYTEDKWEELHINGIIDEYVDFSFQGTSTPHFQDLLAVYELNKRKIIGANDVFLPGHTLDFISGKHFTSLDKKCITKDDAIKRTEVRHSRSGCTLTESVYKKFATIYDESECPMPEQFQEYTNWQERQAKYIVNSCRVYEFFGYDLRLPFWDRELVEFFLNIHPDQRMDRNLLISAERAGILNEKIRNITFEDEIIKPKPKPTIRKKLKRIFPNFLGDLFPRFLVKKRVEPEGLNQVFSKKAKTVNEIIGPITHFPKKTHRILKSYPRRYPQQVNPLILSALYAITRATTKK